jgi:glucose dehydrogenase
MFGMVAARRSARAARNTTSLVGSRAVMPMLAALALGACSRETPPEEMLYGMRPQRRPARSTSKAGIRTSMEPIRRSISSLKDIDKTNVGRSKVAWTYPSDENYSFNPLIVGTTMYVLAKSARSSRSTPSRAKRVGRTETRARSARAV